MKSEPHVGSCIESQIRSSRPEIQKKTETRNLHPRVGLVSFLYPNVFKKRF